MDGVSIAIFATIGLLLLLAARVPVSFTLLAVSIVSIFFIGASQFGGFDYSRGWKFVTTMLSRDPYSFIANFTLMAVPMFLLMGNLAFHTGATKNAFHCARTWLSGLPGGLAVASIGASALFAAISGSSVACAAAMGRIAVPEMLRYGYKPSLATGVVAAGGTLGALIPPSILMIIFGIFAEQSIAKLLIGGFVPGILTALAYSVYVITRVKFNPSLAPPTKDKFTLSDKFASLNGTWQFVLIVLIVMTVIYTGIATPTEAAAIGAFSILVIGLLGRTLLNGGVKKSLRETVAQTGMIFAIAIAAKLLAAFVAFSGVSDALASWASEIEAGRFYILLGICFIYILLGLFLDPIGILLITLPVTIPIVTTLGYDLIWFGVLVVKLLELGMITPPVGLNVFVLKGAVGDAVKLEEMFKGIAGFVLVDIVLIGLFIAIPDIILWLPRLMSL